MAEVAFFGFNETTDDVDPINGLTFTNARTATATYMDSSGAMATAAAGAIRPAYNAVGTLLGRLLEPESTNEITESNDFTTGWNTSSCTVNADQTTAPDGTTTADQLIDDNGGGSGTLRISKGVTVANSTRYTFSVFAKADQLDWISMQPNGFTTPNNPNANIYYDLANCEMGSVGSEIDYAGIEQWADGWCRCWFTFTTDATDTNGAIYIFLANANNDRSCDRDGTSSVFLAGAQFEENWVPTSYIPTSGSTATRDADSLTADIQSLLGTTSELSMFHWMDTSETDYAQPFASVCVINDSTGDNRVLFANNSNSSNYSIQVVHSYDGNSKSVLNPGNNHGGGEHRAMYAGAIDDTYLAAEDDDGAAFDSVTGTDTSGVFFDAVGLIFKLVAPAGYTQIVKQVCLWDSQVADADVDDLVQGNVVLQLSDYVSGQTFVGDLVSDLVTDMVTDMVF